jgi:hypothetical protein
MEPVAPGDMGSRPEGERVGTRDSITMEMDVRD